MPGHKSLYVVATTIENFIFFGSPPSSLFRMLETHTNSQVCTSLGDESNNKWMPVITGIPFRRMTNVESDACWLVCLS